MKNIEGCYERDEMATKQKGVNSGGGRTINLQKWKGRGRVKRGKRQRDWMVDGKVGWDGRIDFQHGGLKEKQKELRELSKMCRNNCKKKEFETQGKTCKCRMSFRTWRGRESNGGKGKGSISETEKAECRQKETLKVMRQRTGSEGLEEKLFQWKGKNLHQ